MILELVASVDNFTHCGVEVHLSFQRLAQAVIDVSLVSETLSERQRTLSQTRRKLAIICVILVV